jgi:hypothetical protein
MFGAKPEFLHAERGADEIHRLVSDRLVANLPPDDGKVVHLTFDSGDWMIMAGVASRLKHEHRAFCVDDLWAFTFGRDNRCQQFVGLTNLILAGVPRACEPPCRILTKYDHWEFQVAPYPALRLPFTIQLDDLVSLNKGFNEGLGSQDPVWTTGHATIYFRVASDFADVSRVRVRIFGSANPGRPARILLNGHVLGTIVAGPDSTEFIVDRTAFLLDENQLVIQVDNPLKVRGDPQNDPRVLGFSFLKAQFEQAEP